MRQASISSTLLKNIGLVIGLGFAVWSSSPAMALPPIRIMQEYCKCTCGGDEVAVTPTTQPPNSANCKAMDNKACKKDSSAATYALTCDGLTIVVRPSFGVERPVAPGQPPREVIE